ncbi:hypothetical protein ACSHWO_33715 [Streptomyces sp. HUAS TT3]|uniref:hypothetical protein n=1 Tax=Streptomyces sp. HUAS TT3 TaxID=3447510 RepID=UPI003F65C87E
MGNSGGTLTARSTGEPHPLMRAAGKGLLNRQMADRYEIPLGKFPVEPAVAGALAWSAAAGLTPDEEAVRRTLTGSALFAEELSTTLLTALGVPGADRPPVA